MINSEDDIIYFCNSGLADEVVTQLKREMVKAYDADRVFSDLQEKLHNKGLTLDLLKGSDFHASFILFERLLDSTYFVERYFKDKDLSELKKYIRKFVSAINSHC